MSVPGDRKEEQVVTRSFSAKVRAKTVIIETDNDESREPRLELDEIYVRSFNNDVKERQVVGIGRGRCNFEGRSAVSADSVPTLAQSLGVLVFN